MDFLPEEPTQNKQEIPFFDDVSAEKGWQGHTTLKPIDTLKNEVIMALNRLGGQVTIFQKGIYLIDSQKREGFQIHYLIKKGNGTVYRGRLDIAALPVKENYSLRRTEAKRKAQSLKMALYMVRTALEGTWFLQQLSPGYAPLMPWMITPQGKTITQLWSEQVFTENLLPSNVIEGEVIE